MKPAKAAVTGSAMSQHFCDIGLRVNGEDVR